MGNMPRRKRRSRAKKPRPQQLEPFNREENERVMWEKTGSGACYIARVIGKGVMKVMAKPEPKPEPEPYPKTGREALPLFLRE